MVATGALRLSAESEHDEPADISDIVEVKRLSPKDGVALAADSGDTGEDN